MIFFCLNYGICLPYVGIIILSILRHYPAKSNAKVMFFSTASDGTFKLSIPGWRFCCGFSKNFLTFLPVAVSSLSPCTSVFRHQFPSDFGSNSLEQLLCTTVSIYAFPILDTCQFSLSSLSQILLFGNEILIRLTFLSRYHISDNAITSTVSTYLICQNSAVQVKPKKLTTASYLCNLCLCNGSHIVR